MHTSRTKSGESRIRVIRGFAILESAVAVSVCLLRWVGGNLHLKSPLFCVLDFSYVYARIVNTLRVFFFDEDIACSGI